MVKCRKFLVALCFLYSAVSQDFVFLSSLYAAVSQVACCPLFSLLCAGYKFVFPSNSSSQGLHAVAIFSSSPACAVSQVTHVSLFTSSPIRGQVVLCTRTSCKGMLFYVPGHPARASFSTYQDLMWKHVSLCTKTYCERMFLYVPGPPMRACFFIHQDVLRWHTSLCTRTSCEACFFMYQDLLRYHITLRTKTCCEGMFLRVPGLAASACFSMYQDFMRGGVSLHARPLTKHVSLYNRTSCEAQRLPSSDWLRLVAAMGVVIWGVTTMGGIVWGTRPLRDPCSLTHGQPQRGKL